VTIKIVLKGPSNTDKPKRNIKSAGDETLCIFESHEVG